MYISICESWHHGHETMQSQLGFAHRDCIWLYRCFQQTVISEISCKNICCNLSIWVLGFFLLPSKIKEELIWCTKGMLVLNQLFIIFSRPVWESKCIGLTAVGWSAVCFSSASSKSLNFDPVLLVGKKGQHLSHRIKLFGSSGEGPKKNRTFLFIVNILWLLCFISTTEWTMKYLERV